MIFITSLDFSFQQHQKKENIVISWIHTLILTHVSDVEASSVGAVVGRPAQQELVPRGGHAEGRLYVAAERRHALAVNVWTWTHRQAHVSNVD